MTAAQWDGLVRVALAGLVWFALFGGALWLNRAAERKRRQPEQQDEVPEPLHGFWQ